MKKMKRIDVHHLLALAGLSAAASLAGGCADSPDRFDPQAIREIQLSKAAENHSLAPKQLPKESDFRNPYIPSGKDPVSLPVKEDRPATRPVGEREVRFTLSDIVHRTAAYNADTRVAAYQVGQDEARVVEALARYDWTFFTNVNYQREDGSNAFSTNALFPRETRTTQVQTGLKRVLPSGAEIQLRYEMNRTKTINDPNDFLSNITPNPYYTSEAIFQITQPLLQNYGSATNRARITVARNDQRISFLDFRLKLEENLTRVEQAYWQLAQARRNVEILESLLQRTTETAERLSQRWGGDVNATQLSQAHASIKSREAALIRARSQVRDLSDEIKRRMGDPDYPVADNTLIVPADQPVETAIQYNIGDQIDTALVNRPEILQQKLRIDSSETIVGAANNNLLPQLNLVGQVGVQGRGEDLGDALTSQGSFDFVNYSVGLQFEVPIGNRGPRAIWARTLLQRLQSIESYRNLTEQITQEVKQSFREVETSWQELVATRTARYAAAESLRAIEEREKGIALDPTFVQLKLDRQAALAQSEQEDVQALVRYNIAVSALERAKGTLLSYDNVEIREEKLPQVRQNGGL